jgi:hypothetical protein
MSDDKKSELIAEYGIIQGVINAGSEHTKVGLHRYIRSEDIMTYKKQRDVQPREGLKELTEFLQDEGFYEDGGSESAKS